jgi:hypothetical protein
MKKAEMAISIFSFFYVIDYRWFIHGCKEMAVLICPISEK